MRRFDQLTYFIFLILCNLNKNYAYSLIFRQSTNIFFLFHQILIHMTGDDPLDCDFEKDLCSWTQGMGDDFDLARYQGNTLTAMTGPSSDHTIGGSKKTNQ